MPPGRCAEVAGVIVRISRPREPVVRDLVPFFARDLASFTADANGRIGEEADFNIIAVRRNASLVRALESFADHRESVFPLLAVTTSFCASGRAARRRLFRMQICWLTSLRRVSLDPIKKSRPARQTARNNVADERLAFHDGDVRFAGNGNQIVGSIAAQRSSRSEVKWNCNLMHGFAIQVHRPDPATDESAGLDSAAQAHKANVVAVADLKFSRKLRRNFYKHFRLQFGKVAEETRHPAAGMVFGQPISGENIRKTRIAGRCETVFSARKPIHNRVCVTRIERVVDR